MRTHRSVRLSLGGLAIVALLATAGCGKEAKTTFGTVTTRVEASPTAAISKVSKKESGLKKESTGENSILAEVERAGKDVKLVEKEILSSFLRAKIRVPDNANIDSGGGTKEDFVVGGDKFAMVIAPGTSQFTSERQRLKRVKFYTVDSDSDDLLLYHDGDGEYRFCLRTVIGKKDYVIQAKTYHDKKQRKFNKADCLLMIKCARSLKAAEPVPSDPRAALEYYGAKVIEDHGKVKKIVIVDGVTDTMLGLLKHFPDLEDLQLVEIFFTTEKAFSAFPTLKNLTKLNLERIHVGDEGMTYLKGCTKLRELRLINSYVTDKRLEVVKGFKNLKKLTIKGGSDEVTEDGIAKLKKAMPGLEVSRKEYLRSLALEPSVRSASSIWISSDSAASVGWVMTGMSTSGSPPCGGSWKTNTLPT